MTPLPFGKISQNQIADRHANQTQHADILGCKQTSNVPVAPFVEHDFEPRILFARAQQRYTLGCELFAVVIDTAQHPVEHQWIGNGINLHVIGLVHVMTRISKPCSPPTVVAEQQ